MSSHFTGSIPRSHLEAENAKEVVQDLYISEGANIGAEGTIPGSFRRVSEDTFSFKYARMEETEINKPRGTEVVSECNEKSILIIKGDMLVVERANKGFQESMVELVEQKFTDGGINLDTVEFSQGSLRTALNHSQQLIKGKYLPSSYDEPDYVAAMDRSDLRQTQFYDSYGQEEIDYLKIFVETGGEDTKISFQPNGKVTVNRHNIDVSEQVRTFMGIYDLITDMVDRWDSVQLDSSGWGAESDE